MFTSLVVAGSLIDRGTEPRAASVQHVIHAFHGAAAILRVADVAYLETERFRVFFDQRQQVFDVSRREIVEADDPVAPFQQRLAEGRADEAGAARN